MASKSKSRRNTASRGFVNNTILECLLDGDKYGYEIIKQVKDKSDGKVVLKEPSLYSSLKRFELKGYITSYWGDSDIGGRRHYYSLTEPGRKYYMSIKSPTPIDLDDIEDDTTDTTEQISIENLNNEIYNLENEVEEVDDSKYINNMSFNVADRMNELLNDNVEEMVDSPTLTESKENVDNIFDTVSEITNDEKELIEEINSAVSVTEEVVDNTCNTTEQDTNTEYQDYMYEHKFRANNSKELSSGTEKYVQYDLFSDNSTVNSYVDAPTIAPSEVTSITEKENISANNTETEITKDIPLIKETEVDFFNWNELKRKATTNKSSFSNSNISRPAKKYDINYSEPQEQTPVQNNIKNNVQSNDYKTTSDLHNLFESNKPNNESKIIDNISPTRVNNKIFDNVKDRIELSDAVLGTKKPVEYNDEPELTEENYEIINQKLNEKINSIAESRTPSQSTLDYKKILGDLYYSDSKSEPVVPINEQIVDETEFDTYDDYNFENTSYEEYVDNDIEDEKVINAINNSKNYSYSTLQESLSNDGFKFKPYTVSVEEDDTEQFVKINKIRFIYGSTMAIIMLLQIAGIFTILKSNGYVYMHDIALYVIALIACIVVFVVYLVPYITRKDERKLKYYNLNYHLMFGILYFSCGLILTYAVNLIMGMNHANTVSYLSKLILPAILLINFVLGPIVYKLLIDNKNIK